MMAGLKSARSEEDSYGNYDYRCLRLSVNRHRDLL